MPPPPPPPPQVWLWLRCEGWVRFGPYPWIAQTVENGTEVLCSRTQERIAWREDGFWRVSAPRYANFRFDAFTVTPTPKHPFPNQSTPERLPKPRPKQPKKDKANLSNPPSPQMTFDLGGPP
jgi:hypothetical protein